MRVKDLWNTNLSVAVLFSNL